MAKVKTIMIGTRVDRTAINRRIVMTIGFGVVKSNKQILLNGGSLQLTENWARGILKSMNWVKRKGAIGQSQKFLLEEKMTF